MPKIDWDEDGDNLPRWEPRPRRDRWPRELRDRRARLDQLIAMAASMPVPPEPPVKRPLHAIWGVPVKRSTLDAESLSEPGPPTA